MQTRKLEKMTDRQLAMFKDRIFTVLAKRREVAEFRQMMTKEAQKLNISLAELIGRDINGRARRGTALHGKKYVHRMHPELTYNGIGRPPKWFKKFGKEVQATK